MTIKRFHPTTRDLTLTSQKMTTRTFSLVNTAILVEISRSSGVRKTPQHVNLNSLGHFFIPRDRNPRYYLFLCKKSLPLIRRGEISSIDTYVVKSLPLTRGVFRGVTQNDFENLKPHEQDRVSSCLFLHCQQSCCYGTKNRSNYCNNFLNMKSTSYFEDRR